MEIVATTLPALRPLVLSTFASREEVVEASMASVHIPLFLDDRLTASLRGEACAAYPSFNSLNLLSNIACRPPGD